MTDAAAVEQPRRGARGPLWWAALVAPLWLVLVLCTHWEPILRDGWSHFDWHRDNAVSLRGFYDYAVQSYRFENPRLGQLYTLLAYTPGPLHAILTPVLELALLALLTALALGRWPSVRRADDAWVGLVITAALAACVPQIGPMLFYRPFTGNYTFGLVVNLLWLVPYRLAISAPRRSPWIAAAIAPVWLGLGAAAGLCNEHTGLAFLALGLAASVVAWRRGRLRAWMIAGLVGLGAGYAGLLTAPGQHVRYLGLADQAGIVERIAARGAIGNLRVVGTLLAALAPLLAAIGLAGVDRWRARRVAAPPAPPAPPRSSVVDRVAWLALALGGVACTLTLLASPKIGPRLYLASVALIAAGGAGWLATALRTAWAPRLIAVVAAAALTWVLVREVAIHAVVGPLGVLRVDRLVQAAPGAVITVPRYPFGTGRYFLGDDFTIPVVHDARVAAHHVRAIVLVDP